MKYSVDKQDHYTILQLEEENMNSDVALGLMQEIAILNKDGLNNLILDLSKVKFIGSAGLGAILEADRFMKFIGNFVLTGVDQPMVKKLFDITRLFTVMLIVATRQEAIELILREDSQRNFNE